MSIDLLGMPEVDEAQTYHSHISGRTVAGTVTLAVGAACMLAWWRWRPFRVVVEGDSMEPASRAGDRLVATRPGRIRRGMVVVALHPSKPDLELIKRVRYGPDDLSPTGERLGEDEYWLEGDRPERSTDSRQFGPIRRAAIRGVVRWRYAGGTGTADGDAVMIGLPVERTIERLGGTMRSAFMSIRRAPRLRRGMTHGATNAQPRNPRPRRRR